MAKFGEIVKITRKLRKTKDNNYFNVMRLQIKKELLVGILGKPTYKIEIDKTIYEWEEEGVKLFYSGPGFFRIDSNDRGMAWFINHFLERAKNYNEIIKKVVYGCKNDIEWSVVKEMIGSDGLIVHLSEIQILDHQSKEENKLITIEFN